MLGANINYTEHECFKINVEDFVSALFSSYTFPTLNYCSEYAIKKKPENLDFVGSSALTTPTCVCSACLSS